MNQTGQYEFSIVVPIYNEEDNVIRLAGELTGYIDHASVRTCVLFVNDGSVDQSLQKIIEVCKQYQHMFYISFDKNYGLSAAIKAGIDRVASPFVGYIDADLQTSPEDFELLLPYREDYELITGIRTGRKDSFGKKISSKIANSFRRMMTHDGVEDTGCPLKVIKSDYAKRIPFFKGMHRFLPALILLQEGKIKQIPVRHFERIAGKSKFHLWNRLVSPFMDCFAYRWMKKRYINYSIETGNIENS
ncbi:MAG: glycosyltransferase [Tannerella sp.]|nr:glycosyltransferase [Tannerella sp.]